MKIKRQIAFLLVAVMSFTLAACSGDSINNDDASKLESTTSDVASTNNHSEKIVKPNGYPSKTIDWLAPVAAGAQLDLHMRALDDAIDLGGNTSITNMPGASQVIGITEAFNRNPDGCTIVGSVLSGLVLQPLLIDTEYCFDDFRHIAMLYDSSPACLVASPSSGINTFDQFKQKVASGEKIHYTCANAGSNHQLAFIDLMNQLGGNNYAFVSYSGTGEVATALMGGHIDFAILDSPIAASYINENSIVHLLTFSDERIDILKDYPCAAEYDITGTEIFSGMMWLAVRKDTPDEIVQWIKAKICEGLNSDAYRAFLDKQNEKLTHIYTEEELTDKLHSVLDVYKGMIKQL